MRDLALFLIMVGLVPLILMRPWTGILAWFWVGLMAPHWLPWGFMRGFPMAQVVALATFAGLVINKDRSSIPMTREMIMLGIFAAYTAMTSYFAVNPDGAWWFWQHLMKILLLTFLAPILIYGQQRIIALLVVITFSVGFYGFKGGIFGILTGGSHMILGPPNSYLEGNTFIGLAMVMVLPLTLVTARTFSQCQIVFSAPIINKLSKRIGLFFYATFWLSGLAIIFTFSRGAWIGLIAVAPLIFARLQRKGLLIFLAFSVVVIVGLSFPDRVLQRWDSLVNYEEDNSAMQRVLSWGVNLNMALERPLLGMGFNKEDKGMTWWMGYANFVGDWGPSLHSPHSVYFNLLGAHGFGGLLVFLLLGAFTFFTFNRIRIEAKRKQSQRWLSEYAWALQVALIGYFTAGAFLDVP
ncbi:MAG: putative O-glycosylation ligase, exosortase A system-associated, partial [Lamprobacter sp.]|uniref:putative O-glycosylation ligase, exosortase A system-associated n=1 Tax=Lamprobacter sp. TaxID=3100796 RepID=UPI002B258E34